MPSTPCLIAPVQTWRLAGFTLAAACLPGLLFAHQIRAATFLAAKDQEKAKVALGAAHGWWMKYSTVMDEMYTGMAMQRSDNLPDWHSRDQFVRQEYTDLGGVGTPMLEETDRN